MQKQKYKTAIAVYCLCWQLQLCKCTVHHKIQRKWICIHKHGQIVSVGRGMFVKLKNVAVAIFISAPITGTHFLRNVFHVMPDKRQPSPPLLSKLSVFFPASVWIFPFPLLAFSAVSFGAEGNWMPTRAWIFTVDLCWVCGLSQSTWDSRREEAFISMLLAAFKSSPLPWKDTVLTLHHSILLAYSILVAEIDTTFTV